MGWQQNKFAMKKPIVALLSPLKNKYSETFIQAHKRQLNGEIKFFFGGWLPNQLEGVGYVSQFRNLSFLMWRTFHKINELRLSKKKPEIDWRKQNLKLAFKKCHINVVFAEYGPTAVNCLKICKALRIPLIVHFHGFDASEKKTLNKFTTDYKEVFAYATYIIGVSEKMMKDLADLGAPPEKLIYNPYGPNDLFFQANAPIKQKKFFSVGRFVDKKAPHLTLLAFKQLLKQHPDAFLYFGGDGPLLNACKDLAEEWDLNQHVIFLGPITPKEVMKNMEDSLAYIQHSVTAEDGDSEGTPIAILEAGAAGLPVISTKHAGIPDIVLDGETGFLVQEKDVQGMSRNMVKLASDFNLAKKMGEAARKRIKEKFNFNRHIQLLNELIEKSIN